MSIELHNTVFDEKVVSLFIRLRSTLGSNLIKVEGNRISQEIKVYVYQKTNIEGVKVLSLEDMIKEALSSIQGIKFDVNRNNVAIKVETLSPTVYEEISVRLYEIEKQTSVKINVSYIT